MNNYRFDGEYAYIQIKRKDGTELESKIDIGDYNLVKDYTWCSHWNYKTKSYYVNASHGGIKIHRLIMNLGNFKENKLVIDHINHDTLNNSRENLRIVTSSENQFNGRYKGYTWHKRDKIWESYIYFNKNYKYLGRYNTEQEAREAYLKAKEIYHIIGGNI